MAKKKGRRIVPGAKVELNQQTDMQQVVEYIHADNDDFEMTEALEQKISMMERCADLIRAHRSRLRVIPILMYRFEITRKSAYQLYNETIQIFSDQSGGQRQFWVDILIGGVAESIRRATIHGDFKAVAQLRKLEKEIIDDYFGDDDTNPYHELQPAPVFLGFYPEETKVTLPKDFEKQLARIKEQKTRWLNQDEIQDAKVIENGAE